MKKLITFLSVCMMAVLPSLASAEANIAVVDIYRALMSSTAAKAAVAELQNEFKPEQERLTQLEQEIKAKQEKGQRDGMLMTEDDKRRLFEEIQSKKADYKHIVQKLQKMQAQREKQFLGQNKATIDAALKELVDELKIDLLVTREATLWVSPDLDITLKLLEKLNSNQAK
ncbi:OmpH family outer membrane protein [Litoribacillus peritrichatus]|uniref:OmpH family outer membrane protein n=1 Tax=Litoribacillus peritrichatus TaxID=718191 RepID=A0ABP7N977_9GAMM